MSFAVDLSSSERMGSGTSSQLFNLVLEAVIFVASELFLRSFDVPRGSSQQNKLLLIQGLVLLAISGSLYLYNGVPFLLCFISLFIIGRVLFAKRPSVAFEYTYNNHKAVISKPLGTIPKNPVRKENSVPHYELQIDNANGLNNTQKITYQHMSKSAHQEEQIKHPQVMASPVKASSYPRSSETGSFVRLRPTRQDFSYVTPATTTEEQPMGTSLLYKPTSPSITPPGLINHGNTCFINSIIQCLVWVPKFSDVLVTLAQKQLQNEGESIFMNCLENVLSQCQCLPDGLKVLNPVSTNHLLSSISGVPQYLVAPAGEGQTQQDAAEFLQWLLSNLHSASSFNSQEHAADETHEKKLREVMRNCEREISEIGSDDLARLKSPIQKLSDTALELHLLEHSSLIYDIFMGQFLEVRQCTTCNRITTSSEYFTVLPLPIDSTDKKLNVRECLLKFISPESLAKDNMIACTCSQDGSTATRLSILSVIPNVLIVQLSRFVYDSFSQSALKNDCQVSFETTFDVFNFSLKKKFEPLAKGSLCYSLQAFCVHSGGHVTSSGHYVSYCKASDGHWYYYNDSNVVMIDDIEQELETDFVRRNSYILFYTKC